ncbi:MAG: OmpA family protein [Deltaproteobacteria bacterium]|nr:OmpA family protein [Deltaproteobacteria bacterium]
MRRTMVLVLLCLGLAVPVRAAPIEDLSVDLQLFQPVAGANDLITVETGEVNSHLGMSLGLSLNYARNPLAVQIIKTDGTKDNVGAIVANRIDTALVAAIGLFDVGELGVAVPLVWQGGLNNAAFEGAGVSVGLEKLQAFALGTVRLIPKARLLQLQDGLLSAALLATVAFPTGTAAYAREAGMMYAPELAVSTRAKFLRAGLNVGYRAREKTRIQPEPGVFLLTVDDEVFAKLGVGLDVNLGNGKPFEIVGEVFGHTPADNGFARHAADAFAKNQQRSRTSAEGDLGIRWSLNDNTIVTGGFGAGLTSQGYGQPAPRFFLGFMHYTGTSGVVDTDQDGVPDALDKCPDKKEDKDGFEDSDGCPDLDNDKDGIPDEDDQCANQPEDKDGIQDEDGCPDADADNDSVPDDKDKCPLEPEDKDGFQDDDGCPELDNDGDNIADGVDQCPNEAEDVDGFQDSDGCPDKDNDNDSLPDLGDMCPNYPEDKDGVTDDDGCPEDNDGDGIADEADKCPNEAEIYNGVDDEDGCPEKLKAKSLVEVTEEKIVIKETILFKTGSAKIMPKSFGLLDQVVAVLKNYKHIKKVRIEGHTDNVGGRPKNLKLSKERAASVREYLVEKGIEATRLESEGYGPDKPIGSNKTAKGRELNRRVEFMIVEQVPIGKDVSEGQTPTPPPAAPAGEPVFDLGPDTAAPPPPPTPAADTPVFDIPVEPPPTAAPPPPAPSEDKPAKGKKGKAKKGKAKPKEDDDEVKFDF